MVLYLTCSSHAFVVAQSRQNGGSARLISSFYTKNQKAQALHHEFSIAAPRLGLALSPSPDTVFGVPESREEIMSRGLALLASVVLFWNAAAALSLTVARVPNV